MSTQFPNAMASEGEAIRSLANRVVGAASLALNTITADDPTLTAAQMVNAMATLSGQTTAQDVTTPSATALLALLADSQIDTVFEFILKNAHTSSGAATIVAGSGVTLVGTTIVPITKTQLFRGVVTNVATPAISLVGLLTAPI